MKQVPEDAARSVRAWRRGFFASIAVAVGLAATLAPYFTSSTEVVRLRNALIVDSKPADHAWTPDNVPPDFRVDKTPPHEVFVHALKERDLVVPGNDWETALRIGRHLLQNVGKSRADEPIQKDLVTTYQRIVNDGDGYCGGFVDAFTGLATAAGIFSRAWAFSFDGFGGHGHVFNEIWDRQARKWRATDVFNNYLFLDVEGEPLSAIGMREALLLGRQISFASVSMRARRGHGVPEKRTHYYVQGLDQWYLWWGNSVFEYYGNRFVRNAGKISWGLEQLTAITLGPHPAIRVLHTVGNESYRSSMANLGKHLLFVAIGAAIAFFAASICAINWHRSWMRARVAADRDHDAVLRNV